MKASTGNVRLSASDLSNHLACNHLTTLDLDVATGARAAPKWNSPDAWVLQQRGLEHENAYIQHLKAQGLSVVNFREFGEDGSAFEKTCAAIRTGADVIVQAALSEGDWFGRADVFRKVAFPSKLGNWSYEIYDCKLAQETKASTILQLSLYSELLAGIQGKWPEFMHVVPPNGGFTPESYRVFDFAAYYRYVKRRLQRAVENHDNGADSYPEPLLSG
jgi:predicted RecB family nuclease